MAINMDCFGLTDIGKQRRSNQDHFMIGDLRKSLEVFQSSLSVDDHARIFGGSQGKLLIVADGMGGHASGQRASTLAIDTLCNYAVNSLPWLFRLEHHSDDEFVLELRSAIEQCERAIKTEGEVLTDRGGMGTTLTIAYIIWPRVYVLHVGDSRCYLFRHSKLWQVTRDHTIAQQLVDNGVLSESQAENSHTSHLLWNCVGAGDEVQPHAHRAELIAGDALLLCSDGLTKHLADEHIEQLLARSDSAEHACRQLVEAANQAGGSDNITVVLASFKDGDGEQELSAHEAVPNQKDKRAEDAPSVPP